MPDKGGNPVEPARGRNDVLQWGAELSFPGDGVLVPKPAQQIVVLHCQLHTVLMVLAKPRIDRGSVAPTQHQIRPPIGDMLQHSEVLGDLHRTIGGDHRGGRGENDSLRLRGDVCQQGLRGRSDERVVMVLTNRIDVHSDLLNLLGDRHRGLDSITFRRHPISRRIRGDVANAKDTDPQGMLLRVGSRTLFKILNAYAWNSVHFPPFNPRVAAPRDTPTDQVAESRVLSR